MIEAIPAIKDWGIYGLFFVLIVILFYLFMYLLRRVDEHQKDISALPKDYMLKVDLYQALTEIKTEIISLKKLLISNNKK
tara:strand:- start:457 stop:696 length:240 start_codon:yes stop_codon:yes gene_type:complete